MPQRTRSARFGEVGVGLNATDTIIRLPPDAKLELHSADIRRGREVASAIVACARSGLRTRYVGKIGEDQAGKLEREDREREGVDSDWTTSPAGNSQTSFLLVDGQSGERTVPWKRDDRIALHPEELRCEWISGARALLIDGQDTAAAAPAARWTRAGKIPIVADIDNLYPGVEELLENIESLVISIESPERLSGEKDLLKSLPRILTNFKCRLIAVMPGYLGAILWDGSRFALCPDSASPIRRVSATFFRGAFLSVPLRGMAA
jgi:sulfofructose kinase